MGLNMSQRISSGYSDIQLLSDLRKAVEDCRQQIQLMNQDRPFVIVVCGAFSTGKTSLLNALLGCDLPTGVNPITKRITRLVYGSRKRIIAVDKNNGNEYELSESTAAALIKYGDGDRLLENVYIRFEIPSPMLEKGIEFVDTPGFEDDSKKKLDQLTKEEIRKGDFCIVNFTSNHFGTMNEMDFLEELQNLTNGNFTIVLNCLNYLNQPGAIGDLEYRANSILKNFGNATVGYGKYFMVDSREGHVYLDNLDKWLSKFIHEHGEEIRVDAIKSRILTRIHDESERGKEAFQKTMDNIQALHQDAIEKMEKEYFPIQLGKHERQKRLENVQRSIMAVFETNAMSAIEAKLHSISPSDFNDQAFHAIREGISTYCSDVYKRINVQFPEIKGIHLELEGLPLRIIKAELLSRTRSLFDPDRYLLGATEYYYNDFYPKSLQTTREVTFPPFRERMYKYFEDAKRKLTVQLCANLKPNNQSEIGKEKQFADSLAKELLNLAALRNSV